MDPDREHLLVREVPAATWLLDEGEPAPWIRWRRRLHSWHAWRARGGADADYVGRIAALGRALEAATGRSLGATPQGPAPRLAAALGHRGPITIKDETGQPAGSHKIRHLLGILLHLDPLGPGEAGPPLAIASCGNAALAAATLAATEGRPLRVFVPEGANLEVVERLRGMGAAVQVCAREPGALGDPSLVAAAEAVGAGAVPFTCQGPANGLAIEGGETLGWELMEQPLPEHLFVQVGGGALISAVASALWDGRRFGRIPRLPRLHAVQTEGGFPLARAWDALSEELAEALGWSEVVPPPEDGSPLAVAARARRASVIAADWHRPGVQQALDAALGRRARYSRPWPQAPRSLAEGILDDECVDWWAASLGMLRSGGYPVVAPEAAVVEAASLGPELTGIDASPTGTSGLAGLLTLARAGGLAPDDGVGLLFTGRAG